jgi:hypothetical protein
MSIGPGDPRNDVKATREVAVRSARRGRRFGLAPAVVFGTIVAVFVVAIALKLILG